MSLQAYPTEAVVFIEQLNCNFLQGSYKIGYFTGYTGFVGFI